LTTPGKWCDTIIAMEYTISNNSSSDPWQDFEIQSKADMATYDEEEIVPEVGVDDCEEDNYDEEDED